MTSEQQLLPIILRSGTSTLPFNLKRVLIKATQIQVRGASFI
jgi:hypothetical protein